MQYHLVEVRFPSPSMRNIDQGKNLINVIRSCPHIEQLLGKFGVVQGLMKGRITPQLCVVTEVMGRNSGRFIITVQIKVSIHQPCLFCWSKFTFRCPWI